MLQKLYLYVIITHIFLYISAIQSCKQIINLLYNDVKNVTSILSYCIDPKCVSSNDATKALFLYELQFALIFTSQPLNHQRTNKQLITILYNEMKSSSSIFSCCNGVNIVTSKKDWKHYIREIITFLLFL